GVRSFWRSTGPPVASPADPRALLQAIGDSARLRYLDGGGAGCTADPERPTDPDSEPGFNPERARKLYHHATFYGFLLCFASTSIATLYHYALGRAAPYPWYDLPVVLGTVGGLGLLIGPAGLLAAKRRGNPALQDEARFGMDVAFLVMLFLAGLTGLALLVLRATPAMGTLLALHLGVVFALFLTMPYGKFVHGIYRFAALLRYAQERRVHTRHEV
ncbi:MAG: tricarballylate utilization protein TcuB, partial [Hyphomicrobiaceae bacterium]